MKLSELGEMKPNFHFDWIAPRTAIKLFGIPIKPSRFINVSYTYLLTDFGVV